MLKYLLNQSRPRLLCLLYQTRVLYLAEGFGFKPSSIILSRRRLPYHLLVAYQVDHTCEASTDANRNL